MTGERTTVSAREVRIGDRVVTAAGRELTVTRIDAGLLGREDLIALVEDSDDGWFKQPLRVDGEIEVIRPAGRRSLEPRQDRHDHHDHEHQEEPVRDRDAADDREGEQESCEQ